MMTTYGDDPGLVAAMDRLRDVASTGLRLREDQGLRVRLPLASVTIAGPDELSAHEATVGGEPLRFSLKVS